MSTSLGIGVGAPGLGAPVPSPGVTARLDVEQETHWPDGEVDVRRWSHEWQGYTALEAADARYKRLKDVRRDVVRDGLTLTIRTDLGGWIEVERLMFADTT